MPKRKDEQLWLRLGDAGGYETFGDDFSAVADVLFEFIVKPPLIHVAGGIVTDDFQGNNYISLYWGDTDANLLRNLTSAELARLTDELEGIWTAEGRLRIRRTVL